MIAFINSFLSYVLLMVIILIVAAAGFAVGRVLRKRKNAQLLAEKDNNNE
ncbi:MAG: FeoB-associated Cys-rich membrane protein [Lachnospiraceae bacterium]|nr:FeoB-associated Cys-rich membrane protein [Lachnospiraceae bacterium]